MRKIIATLFLAIALVGTGASSTVLPAKANVPATVAACIPEDPGINFC